MIVGQEIIDRRFLANGNPKHLHMGTYNLTIGEIVPIGKDRVLKRISEGGPKTYLLEPREVVFFLSKEQFSMPKNVTAIATLKTGLTRQGLLSLTTGIIDPLYEGPVSTSIINFSDRARRIDIGDEFFRVVFFEHNAVSEINSYKKKQSREDYLKEIETMAATEFPTNFLNLPLFDDEFYASQFGRLVGSWIKANRILSLSIGLVIVLILVAGWPNIAALIEVVTGLKLR